MGLFKRKDKCKFHEWKLSDYKTRVTEYDSEGIYEITCKDCFKSKIVDEYDYREMKRLGLIKE